MATDHGTSGLSPLRNQRRFRFGIGDMLWGMFVLAMILGLVRWSPFDHLPTTLFVLASTVAVCLADRRLATAIVGGASGGAVGLCVGVLVYGFVHPSIYLPLQARMPRLGETGLQRLCAPVDLPSVASAHAPSRRDGATEALCTRRSTFRCKS